MVVIRLQLHSQKAVQLLQQLLNGEKWPNTKVKAETLMKLEKNHLTFYIDKDSDGNYTGRNRPLSLKPLLKDGQDGRIDSKEVLNGKVDPQLQMAKMEIASLILQRAMSSLENNTRTSRQHQGQRKGQRRK